MQPTNPWNVPISSFPTPVSPPGIDPGEGALVGVFFNPAWLPYIIGALFQLQLQSTWKVDTDDALNVVQGQASDLLYLFSIAQPFIQNTPFVGADSEDFMIRQSPDNPCIFQTSVNGTDWCDWADLSKCQNFGTQPGITPAPPSGGGGQQTCGVLEAQGHYLVPALVSSGDQIKIDISGAGWDGAEFDIGPLWRLPNGDQFVGGLDVGFPTTIGSDPIPSANHMSIIAVIGGTPTYLALTPGSFVTVPGGISNAQVYLQANDADITNNQGSYSVCVTVKNNASATWLHTFDFTSSPFGWSAYISGTPAPRASWVPGLGWANGGVEFLGVVQINSPAFASTDITSIDVTVSTPLQVGGTDSIQFCWPGIGGACNLVAFPNPSTTVNVTIGASTTGLFLNLESDTGMSSVYSGYITKVVVHGTGSDPF